MFGWLVEVRVKVLMHQRISITSTNRNGGKLINFPVLNETAKMSSFFLFCTAPPPPPSPPPPNETTTETAVIELAEFSDINGPIV